MNEIDKILIPKSKEYINNYISKLSKHELNNKLIEASYAGFKDIVKIILDAGCDVNAKDSFGWNALRCATARGHIDIVSMLLKKGANVNDKTVGGWTSLDMAYAYNHLDIITILKEYGAVFNKK